MLHDAGKNYAPDVVRGGRRRDGPRRAAWPRCRERPGLERLAGRLGALVTSALDGVSGTDPEAAEFLEALDGALPDDAIVVCDMCIPGYWLGGFRSPGRAAEALLPARLGHARLRLPAGTRRGAGGSAAPRVSVSGDGGFLYACGDLATAAQERIPLTAVVVDDGGYGMLRFDQDRRGDPHEGVDLVTPDFVSLAGSFGVRAEAVDGPRRRVCRGARTPCGAGRALVAPCACLHGSSAEHFAALVQGCPK